MPRTRRKRRLKRKYRLLLLAVCCAVLVAAVALLAKACRWRSGEDLTSSAVSSFGDPGVSGDASSVLPGSSETPGSSSGLSSSSAGTSSQKPVSSSGAGTSSQKPVSSNSGTALTGIYKGIQWRSPTAVPCTFLYGRTLLLVNNDYELPEDFQWNLVYYSSGKPVTKEELQNWDANGWNYTKVADAEAYGPLKKMFADAKAAGVPLNLVSSFRSIKLQDSLFNDYVVQNMNKGMSREDAIKAANTLRTYAGNSEHNTGLCFDIAEAGSSYLRVDFENTAQGKWLKANAPRYGFILRYPKEKQAVTGISYEPWHFRYVGVEHAQKITSQGMCLEEYIDSLGGA